MPMKINHVCDRCGRTREEEDVDPDKFVALVQERKDMEATVATFKQLVENHPGPFPVVITILKEEDGKRTVKAVYQTCDPTTGKKRGGTGCSTRIEELVHDIHLDRPQAPRKPREKKKD